MTDEIMELDDALENIKDNPPDGFMINMIYYDTSVVNDSHPLHMTLETIKQDFGLELRKRAVQVKALQYYQVDMVWFGEFERLGAELKRLDKILGENNNSWLSQGLLKNEIGMNIAFVMKENSENSEHSGNADADLF